MFAKEEKFYYKKQIF